MIKHAQSLLLRREVQNIKKNHKCIQDHLFTYQTYTRSRINLLFLEDYEVGGTN